MQWRTGGAGSACECGGTATLAAVARLNTRSTIETAHDVAASYICRDILNFKQRHFYNNYEVGGRGEAAVVVELWCGEGGVIMEVLKWWSDDNGGGDEIAVVW